jgi:hypothetical protein
MLNVVLTHGPQGLQLMFELGSKGAVLGFLGAPLPAVVLLGIAFCCLAACWGGNRRGYYDPRGRVVHRRNKFWAIAAVVVLVVLASRVHRRVVIDRGNQPIVTHTAVPQRDGVERAFSQLERELDHVGNQLDRVGDQVERALDHETNQIDTQVDRRTTELARQLERTAAQIRRQVEHVALQLARRHRETVHAVPIAVVHSSSPTDDPAVIEPSPPALPISGFIEVDAQAPAPPATPAPAAAPAARAATPSPSADVSHTAATQSSGANTEAVADTGGKADSHDWIKTEIVDEGHRKLVVVPGSFGATPKDAEHEALAAARLVIGDAIQRAYPKVGNWLPSVEAVHEDAVRRTYVEEIHRKTVSSGTPIIVYRAYQQVELSPPVFSRLVSNWKEEVVPHRLEALGGLAALLTLTFATGAAYFRLDDRTRGRYRVPLGIAAVSIIVVAAGAAAAVLI